MKYSKLFGKTVKDAKRDMTAASHKLLYRGGFIRELSAGRYEFLPLGMRVWKKMVNLIDQEMEGIGSQRVSIPILQPLDFWQKTNRDAAWGNLLMKIKDRNQSDFALSATGEGVITEMVADTQPSYKDLPIIVHQFIIKLRDEMRPRGGLLRTREFVMKDAYNYHATEESFMKSYQDFYDAYGRICDKLDLEYYPCIADSGALGGDYCHEFQVPCEAGEDKVAQCPKCKYTANIEKAEFIRKKVNQNEEILEYKIVDLPKKVAKIKQLMAHYQLPAERFIKNVVYKTSKGKLVIATVTGDLEVNDVKLARVVGEDELELATEADLAKIGAKTGFVHSWGYEEHKDKIIFVVDEAIPLAKNLYGGFKTETTDPINVNYKRDFKADIIADIAEPYDGALCKQCQKGKLKLIRSIEFGHIFKYDHFYTKHHNGYFIDQTGQKKLMYMGAYGIGIGRAIAIVVEKHHDQKGIIWPESVAPFQVHLIDINQKAKAQKIYDNLIKNNIETLWDDRDESAGKKFMDADLIGCPIRLVVSEKTNDKLEYKKRDSDKVELLDLKQVLERIK